MQAELDREVTLRTQLGDRLATLLNAQTVNPITFCHIVKEADGNSDARLDLCSLIRRYGDIRSDHSNGSR